MRIEVIPVSPLQQNARLVICEDTNEAILIDPGYNSERIIEKIKDTGVTVKFILATHGHIDHIGAVKAVKDILGIPFYMNKEDLIFFDSLLQHSMMFGMPNCQVPEVDVYVNNGETFSFGNLKIQSIHTPGHSPGSISYLIGNDIFTGDVIFSGSIGRTDLPGGSFQILEKSIKERLYTLPSDVVIHPGHGPSTTVGHEKSTNPFVKG